MGISDLLPPGAAPTDDPLLTASQPNADLETKPQFDVPKPTPAPAGPTPPDDRAALRSAFFLASKRPPAPTWAGVLKASQQLQMGPSIVGRNYDRALGIAQQQQPDLDRIVNNNPALTHWLSDPDNATLAQHELQPLARLDSSTGLLARATSDVGTATATGAADLASAAGQLAVAYGMASPASAARFVADMNQRAQSLRAEAPDYAKEYDTALGAKAANVDQSAAILAGGNDASGAPPSTTSKILNVLSRIGSFAAGPGSAPDPRASLALGDVLDLVRTAAARPRGLAYSGVESLASMAPMLAGAAAGTAAGAAIGSAVPIIGTAAGGLVGGMTGTFAGMAPVNVGSDITAELTKRGVDVTNADALERAFSDPDVMAAVRSKAERNGITSALVASLVSGYAGKLADAATGANLATRTAARAADVGIQAAGMGAGQAAGQAAAGDRVSVGQAIQTAISTLGVSAGMEAIGESRRALLHPETAQAAVEATSKADDALQAHHDAALLQEIGDAVKQAPTTAQVPDRLRDLVETAAGGADASTVYFQGNDWNKYWLAQGESPAQKAADVMGDNGTGYTESQATGAPIAIPLADYVAHVAPTEHFDGLLGAARMRPDGASLEEAQAYLRDLPATFHELATEAASTPAPPTADAATIGTDVERQLRAAGVARPEAKANAALWESAFRNLADRTQRDPLDLYGQYGVRIERGAADATDTAPAADALNQGANSEAPLPPRDERGPTSNADMVRQLADTGPIFSNEEAAQSRARAAKVLDMLNIGGTPEFEQSGSEGTPRGRIRLGERGFDIALLEHADRSTFLHETGHAFLFMLDKLGEGNGAPADLAADRATIREWVGATDGTELTREQHEQFARGFEAYLAEGKAPSDRLAAVFTRFRRWLTGVYRDLRALNVTLTPDVRGVFDRLLASHDELEAARRGANTEPLFGDPKSVGLSDAQAASYRAAVAEARQAAEDQVTNRVMRQMRREESSEWRTQREPIEAAVTKDVDAEPVYRARALMERGTLPDGSALPEGTEAFKLSKAAIVRGFGDELLNGLPRGVYATEGGIHPDVAAELLGFGSGRELLDALRAAPNRADEIRARTDARMQQEHGEQLSDDQLRDQASLAVRNEKRTQLLRKELEILASDHLATMKGLVRAIARVVPSSDAVRAQAETMIGAKAVNDVKPHLYDLAAAKAAREAREALLRGDIEGAFDAKRRELLNTALLHAATDARDAVDGALEEFKRVFRRDERLKDTRDMDLVNAARAILATFGIGRTDRPAASYLEQIRKYDPDTYDTVSAMVDDATANARNYRQLSIDDFGALRDTVRGLWEMSRRARQIEIDGRKVEREAIVGELTARLNDVTPEGPKPGERQAVTKGEKRIAGFASMWAALRRVEHWVRQTDAGADDGPFRRYLWNPVNEGAIKYRVEKNERMAQYQAIVDELGPTMAHDKIPAPELGYTFDGKRELLGAVLHTGNESNLRKLLVGRHWGALDENGVVDSSRWRAFIGRMHAEGTLVKADYDFAQAVWNLFEETKPGAQRAHRDMYGRYFEEITATPFATPFGRYEGGYYPAKADPFLVPEQGRRESATAVVESDNSSLFPSTGRGFTKSRVEYNRPLIIDANAIPTHLDAVLRFTHINPHVVDVARLLRDRTFAGAMDDADPHAISELLDPWLRRTAQQAIDTPARSKAGRAVDDMARRLRRNAGMQILSASLTTAAEQLTHVPAVALRVEPTSLARGLWEFTRAPKQTAAEIHAKSDYMATRESAGLMEVRRAIDHIMLDPSTAQRAGGWLNEHASFLTRAIQHVEDHVTWGGAYDQAVRDGMEEPAAVRHADAVVRETLGAFEPESISRFEASAPVVKLFSMFYSFFNTKANFLKTEATNVLQQDVGLTPKVAKLAAVYTFGFMLPAVMASLIKQQLNGQRFDKNGDGPWDDLFGLFFGSQLEQAGRMIPVAGPLAQFSVAHLMGGKPADLVSSPALGLIQQAAQVPADVLHAVKEGDIRRGEITDLFTLIGLISGTPARPLAKPLGYLTDVRQGKAHPTSAADMARGLLTGR